MPSPSALDQWAIEQTNVAAEYFDDPGCMYDWQIELFTRESKQTIPIVQRLLSGEIDASTAASRPTASARHVCAGTSAKRHRKGCG
ncbi:uncharacterized protein PG998_004263 [Apiospora kogelbergensis]|uniref:uncharacterized protein n=1 Tax=Apiospora kogelbergensis TaxID=1337665 RepID=UPI00312ED5EB